MIAVDPKSSNVARAGSSYTIPTVWIFAGTHVPGAA